MQSGDTFFTRPIAAEAERRPAAGDTRIREIPSLY